MESLIVAVCFCLSGFISGAAYSIFREIRKVSKSFILGFALDIVWCLIAGFCFIFCVFRLNAGGFAFFEVLSFLIGFYFELIFVQNLFASLAGVVYNRIKQRGKKNDPSKINKHS